MTDAARFARPHIRRAALHAAYAECETRADVLGLVMDALDQAGAPLLVQGRVHAVLSDWDVDATIDAREAWEASER